MPQAPLGNVPLAAAGIDQITVLVLGNSIDRQVTAQQVLLDGGLGIGVDLESPVTRPGLALAARPT